MKPNLGLATFLTGLAVIGWVASGYLGSSLLALTITVLIGTVYLLGALELRRFHRATCSLGSALSALSDPIDRLDDWLVTVDPSLRSAVRLRIEGERSALPGPAMTPYLVGLLVLLGMLGTFLGMVVTLDGTVTALENSGDLATMRSALAAPVKGLGLAFGTSVAGVAASAMLGLLLALRRRERLQQAQVLDAKIATILRPFSRAHQRQLSFDALQQQSQLMPELVATMQAALLRMDLHHEALGERLLAGQHQFHSHAQSSFSELARSVDQSLQRSVRDAAQAAGDTIKPLVETTLSAMTHETGRFQQQMVEQVGQQLDGIASRFDSSVKAVDVVWSGSLQRQQMASDNLLASLQQSLAVLQQRFEQGFERQSATLHSSVTESHAQLQAALAAADKQRLEGWETSIESMQHKLHDEWQRAGTATLASQQQICATLEHSARAILVQAEAQARDTIAEIARLVASAAQAPQAAADVIAELRGKLSESVSRDNALLEERSRIIGSLDALLDTAGQSATRQRDAIDALVDSSAAVLQRAGEQFASRIESESSRIEAVAAEVSASSVEASSVGEAFGLAVQMFSEASGSMIDQLQRIETALARSSARSDEQLGYFVAQAREIIDLSVSSQQQIIDRLQQLSERPQALVGEPA